MTKGRTIYRTLLHEADALLDYWQEELITTDRPAWVQGKIHRTKLSIASTYREIIRIDGGSGS